MKDCALGGYPLSLSPSSPLYMSSFAPLCAFTMLRLYPTGQETTELGDYRLNHESKESDPHPVVPLAILQHWWEADEQRAAGGPGEYTKKPEWALNRLLNRSLVTTLGQWVVADWLIGWGKS